MDTGTTGTVQSFIPVPPVPVQSFIPVPDTTVISVRTSIPLPYTSVSSQIGKFGRTSLLVAYNFDKSGMTSTPVLDNLISSVRH